MVASYPGTVRTFTSKTDIVDTVYADHPNSLQDEVVAVEKTLGLNPHVSTSPSASGSFNGVSTVFSSLAARLANIETGVVGDAHTQYLRRVGGDVVTPGSASTIGLRIRCATSQTADLLQFLDSSGATKAAFGADGSLTVNNLTVNGTQTNVAGSATALDLGATTGIAGGTGANFGDKIQLYQSNYGLGVQSNRMVAWLPANAGLAVRLKSGSGFASSGTDAVLLNSDGTAQFTGLATLKGGLDLSSAGATLAGTGTTIGDKLAVYTNTGLGVTDATHLSLFLNGTGSMLQIAPANTGAGAKSAGLTPGAQFTGGGIANFKTDARINNVPVPRGYIDSGTRTTNGALITAETMMAEHQCAFTAVAGHRYRVTLTVSCSGPSNDQLVFFVLRDGTSTDDPQLQGALVNAHLSSSFGLNTFSLVWLVAGLSAGAHTLTPSIQPYGGGSIAAKASAGVSNFMLVEDIGALAQAAL